MIPLSEFKEGERGLIVRVNGRGQFRKRLQEMVSRRLQGPRFDPEVSCSISIGYAVQSGRHPFSTSKRWIEAADEALYQAKQLGRNTAVGHQMKRPGTRVG